MQINFGHMGQLMFKERLYDSPTDANGDSTYEVEVATASGSGITKQLMLI